MKKLIVSLLLPFLLLAAALCGFFFWREYQTAQEEVLEYVQIRETYTAEKTVSGNMPQGLEDAAEAPSLSVDFTSLLDTNPETVGWLSIPGTGISYPVAQARDNEKYLHTSFYGKHSGTGTVFMDCGNAAMPLDRNTILYGHNMGQGRTDMFGSLLRYTEKEFYDAHRQIQFDTVWQEHSPWRVFAVIQIDADAAKWDYLKQSFRDETDFQEWIVQAQVLSLYDADMPIPEGANILTLSTCDRSQYGAGGRLVVLAVRTREILE